jgi:cbb3-type cytochrome oxidase maturation protein
MSVFLILIPISLGLAVAFVLLCLASIRGGQFDDLESPRWRILFDEPAIGLRQSPRNEPDPEIAPLTRKNHEAHPV